MYDDYPVDTEVICPDSSSYCDCDLGIFLCPLRIGRTPSSGRSHSVQRLRSGRYAIIHQHPHDGLQDLHSPVYKAAPHAAHAALFLTNRHRFFFVSMFGLGGSTARGPHKSQRGWSRTVQSVAVITRWHTDRGAVVQEMEGAGMR